MHYAANYGFTSNVRKRGGRDASSHRAAILHGLMHYSSARLNCDRFSTNASFQLDEGNSNKTIKDIVVRTTDGQRVPISIKDVEIVGFKKAWQIWIK